MEDMANHTHVNLAAEILKKEQELKRAKRQALAAFGDLCWAMVVMGFNLALAFFGMLYQGFIVSKIWLWFAVPFFKLPPMGVAEVTGLICLWVVAKGGVRYTEYKALSELKGKEKWGWFATGLIFESTMFWFAYILKGHL
jgi:hypothetical protein